MWRLFFVTCGLVSLFKQNSVSNGIMLMAFRKYLSMIHTGKRNQSHYLQFSSVAQSCPTLCDPMNRSTPGLPVHHHLLEFTHTHVHWVRDAPFSSWPQFLPASESFPVSQLFALPCQGTGVSALASFLPQNTQGWSPSEWTGLDLLAVQGTLKSLLQHHSSKPINSSVLSLLHSPTLTSIHDHWTNHSLD